MKRAILLPIIMGLFFVCPIANQAKTDTYSSHTKQAKTDTLDQILSEAVALFQAEYGIETSIEALQTGYNDGSVTTLNLAHLDDCSRWRYWEVVFEPNGRKLSLAVHHF